MDENSSKMQGAVTVSEEIQIAETFQETLEYLDKKSDSKDKLDK